MAKGTGMALVDGAQDGSLDEALGRRIHRAIATWTGQLVDITGRNTLLCFKDLKAGTLELTAANEVALEQLLGTHSVRFSEAFSGDEVAPAARRGRAILARADENYQEKGLQTLFVAWGMATWTNTRSTFTPCAPDPAAPGPPLCSWRSGRGLRPRLARGVGDQPDLAPRARRRLRGAGGPRRALGSPRPRC